MLYSWEEILPNLLCLEATSLIGGKKILKQDYILVYSHQEENAILTFKKNV